jgi:hemerythrin-like domain-containing protein
MKNKDAGLRLSFHPVDVRRREFLKKGAFLGALSGLGGLGVVTACSEEGGEEVTPAEDLMREHGVLNRIMLVYDDCRLKLANQEHFPVDALYNSAQMIRSFIEDYHEMLEEKFLFPRFINANKLVDLVQLLYVQHHAGRVLTDQILKLANANTLTNAEDSQKLIGLLVSFNRMYRPHEAREDSVLFPALKSIVSGNEYDAMGEDFEKKEHELFGADGFETMVNKIAGLEKQLGIYDMSVYTPAV